MEISETRYKDLMHAELLLTLLEKYGVENWEGGKEAYTEYYHRLQEEYNEHLKKTDAS